MNDEEYKIHYYKRFEKEPKYTHALVVCKEHIGEILTDAGVRIKASYNGLLIQYQCKDGRKLTALVHSREQYIIELYRISTIAESEHPELIKVIEEPKKANFIMEEESDKRRKN